MGDKDIRLKRVSNPGPLDQQGSASPTQSELPGLVLPQWSYTNVRICVIFLTSKLENFCLHRSTFVGIWKCVKAHATLGIFVVSGSCIGKGAILIANSENPDQVMQLCSLICMFFICSNNLSWESTNWIVVGCAGWTESLLFVSATLRHLSFSGNVLMCQTACGLFLNFWWRWRNRDCRN